MLTFDEYQKKAWDTAIYPDKGKNIYYPSLGLGEVGEIQNIVKKIFRDNKGQVTEEVRQSLKSEIGDLQWYVATLATELGLSLEEIAEYNLQKLHDRKERGVIGGSGDNR